MYAIQKYNNVENPFLWVWHDSKLNIRRDEEEERSYAKTIPTSLAVQMAAMSGNHGGLALHLKIPVGSPT